MDTQLIKNKLNHYCSQVIANIGTEYVITILLDSDAEISKSLNSSDIEGQTSQDYFQLRLLKRLTSIQTDDNKFIEFLFNYYSYPLTNSEYENSYSNSQFNLDILNALKPILEKQGPHLKKIDVRNTASNYITKREKKNNKILFALVVVFTVLLAKYIYTENQRYKAEEVRKEAIHNEIENMLTKNKKFSL